MPRKDPQARAEYRRQYREKHREYFKEYNREYRRKNLERLRAYDRARRPVTQRNRLGQFVRGRLLGMCEKATPKATATRTIRGLAWAAGFIEGEGYFARNGISSQVCANQVQREPVDRLQALFGGSVRRYHNERHNARWSAQWRWAVSGARARGVMLTLYPMMSPRRQAQIRHALGHDVPADLVA